MPDMIYVDSSNIEAIGYDDEAQELHVQFAELALVFQIELRDARGNVDAQLESQCESLLREPYVAGLLVEPKEPLD